MSRYCRNCDTYDHDDSETHCDDCGDRLDEASVNALLARIKGLIKALDYYKKEMESWRLKATNYQDDIATLEQQLTIHERERP